MKTMAEEYQACTLLGAPIKKGREGVVFEGLAWLIHQVAES
jgi:hypothetical protein